MSDEQTMPVSKPFSIQLFARWPDMDFNQHMRNAAYLGASEDCRMRFLAERGFTMEHFRERKLGPVVLEDRLTYKKELKLLEAFRVELALANITRDGRRMRVRNTFYRDSDGAPVATVESVVLWFDLAARKPIAPPEELKDIWLSLARTDDFGWYDDKPA
jgi:acyl-CoA thioester hydrolase